MPANNKANPTGSGVNEHQAKTRLLLALWDMGASKTEVAKGQLTRRIVQKGQKLADYQGIIDQLEQEGAIASTSCATCRLTDDSMDEMRSLLLVQQAEERSLTIQLTIGVQANLYQ